MKMRKLVLILFGARYSFVWVLGILARKLLEEGLRAF